MEEVINIPRTGIVTFQVGETSFKLDILAFASDLTRALEDRDENMTEGHVMLNMLRKHGAPPDITMGEVSLIIAVVVRKSEALKKNGETWLDSVITTDSTAGDSPPGNGP